MLKRIPFPDYAPDQPLTADNSSSVIAAATGYRPLGSFSPVTSALAGILGGAAYVGSDGGTALLAGTATNIYHYVSSAWTSVLGSLTATNWRFDQFNNYIIGVNGDDPVRYDMAAGTAITLPGSPPKSSMVATIRNQVFLAGDPADRSAVSISGYDDCNGWTAGTNQSLYVPFPSGGEIMGLAGGETGIILQQRSVRRAIYTGDITVWQFDEISRDVGCMAKGSVAQAGQYVFFLSDQGFKMCDRNEVIPIGSEAVDRAFFSEFARTEIIDNIRAAVDPRSTEVVWAMPGNPGYVLRYNWTLRKWSPPARIAVKSVFQGFTLSFSLEDLDTLYPSGLDSIPVSLDSTMFAGGAPLLFAVNNSDVVGTLTGSNTAATIAIPPIEVEPGKRVRIRGARLVGDAVEGTVTIDQRARAGDAEVVRVSGSIRNNGRVPLRANGRHIGISASIPAGAVWTYAHGIDLEYTIEGGR